MNIGDYVRLNNCVYDIVVINRVAEIYEDTILTENDGSIYQGEYTKEEIIKSSPNIIDLIEEGDYVNGKKVEWIGYGIYQDTEDGLIGIGDKFILFNEFTRDGTREKGIKSILTKEQFESMEYKL